MSEVLNGTVYWLKAREGFFVHNDEWDKVIERLPGLISHEKVSTKLQSLEQLLGSGLRGTGSIGHNIIEVKPDTEALVQTGYLYDGSYSVENLFLQWVYQFTIIEGVSAHLHNTPLPEWGDIFLTIAEETIHAMTYIAALIYLYEKAEFKALVDKDNFRYTELRVREMVEELTATLYSKCAEYGESFRRHGLQGTLPRLWDKIARYAQLSALGRSAKYEPKLDSAKDLLGYCIIAWSLIHELDEQAVDEVAEEATIQQDLLQ